jgi:hypothetical protein
LAAPGRFAERIQDFVSAVGVHVRRSRFGTAERRPAPPLAQEPIALRRGAICLLSVPPGIDPWRIVGMVMSAFVEGGAMWGVVRLFDPDAAAPAATGLLTTEATAVFRQPEDKAPVGPLALRPQEADPPVAMSAQPPDAPDNASPKQDGRFRKGVSGKPAGMRRGTQHKLTREGSRGSIGARISGVGDRGGG